MDHNFIGQIDPVFKECLPMLELLSFGHNGLMLQYSFIFDTIYSHTKLCGFNISVQRMVTSGRWLDYSENFVFQSSEDIEKAVVKNGRHISAICKEGMTCPLYLPPNTQWIDMSQNGFILVIIPQLLLLSNNSLKFLDSSYNGIHSARLPVYCAYNVIPQIETIDLSNNGIQCINATFFNKSITSCDWTSFK